MIIIASEQNNCHTLLLHPGHSLSWNEQRNFPHYNLIQKANNDVFQNVRLSTTLFHVESTKK